MKTQFVQNKVVTELVNSIDPKNAEYILTDWRVQNEIEGYIRNLEKGDLEMAGFYLDDIERKAREYDETHVAPSNVEIGDGVTRYLYSDRHAFTVIKKTATSITVQRDRATLVPTFKPEIVPGGFVGHCVNNDEQEYTYERDPNGETVVFRWSRAKQRYMAHGSSVGPGRHEKYDYNF